MWEGVWLERLFPSPLIFPAITLLWTLLTGKEVGQRMLMYRLLCLPASASGAALLLLEEEDYNEWNYQGVTYLFTPPGFKLW